MRDQMAPGRAAALSNPNPQLSLRIFGILCYRSVFQDLTRLTMEQTPAPRRRLDILGKAARTKRIFTPLREGWGAGEPSLPLAADDERDSAELPL